MLIDHYPLKTHNTFGFDVTARYACFARDLAQLRIVLREPRVAALPRLVLGGGSNVVLTGDFNGLALIIALTGRRLVYENADAWFVEAGAGENWHAFVDYTLAAGWPGLENLALIPGTVGAAPIQNIGAYGVELAQRFDRLYAFDMQTGESVEFDRQACYFGYRDSVFKQAGRNRYLITSVRFRLPKRWRPCIDYADVARAVAARPIASVQPRDLFNAIVAIRHSKLPDPAALGNAGSFFKNPVIDAASFAALRAREPGLIAARQADGRVKLAAGWLIDRCGWKGRALGAAAVHPKQALVLVNRGGATGPDVLALASAIQADVRSRFGVELEPEPLIV